MVGVCVVQANRRGASTSASAAQPAHSPLPQPATATPPPLAPSATPPQVQGGPGGAANVSDLASAFLELLQNSGGPPVPPAAAQQPPVDLLTQLMNSMPGGAMPGGMPGIPGLGASPGDRRGGSRRSQKRQTRPPVTPQWIKDFAHWQLVCSVSPYGSLLYRRPAFLWETRMLHRFRTCIYLVAARGMYS